MGAPVLTHNSVYEIRTKIKAQIEWQIDSFLMFAILQNLLINETQKLWDLFRSSAPKAVDYIILKNLWIIHHIFEGINRANNEPGIPQHSNPLQLRGRDFKTNLNKDIRKIQNIPTKAYKTVFDLSPPPESRPWLLMTWMKFL